MTKQSGDDRANCMSQIWSGTVPGFAWIEVFFTTGVGLLQWNKLEIYNITNKMNK